jgi:hypothetical protein
LFILYTPQIVELKLETPEKSVFQQAKYPLPRELHKPCQNLKNPKKNTSLSDGRAEYRHSPAYWHCEELHGITAGWRLNLILDITNDYS